MKEDIISLFKRCYKNEMVAFINEHPFHFNDLIQLAIYEDNEYSWRAAWLLWSCMEKNDERIIHLIDDIFSLFNTKKSNLKRELFKILQKIDVDDNHKGKLFDICIKEWLNIDNQPAVRFNAFKMLYDIAKSEPTLLKEILYYTQEHYLQTLSPGGLHSVEKIISSIKS